MTEANLTKHDHVLAGLVFQLQAVAMQQLGKLQDQRTGEIARDLEGARHTIDILDMLKAKCRADTPAELLRVLDQAVMDLQLNYMDETKREEGQEADEPGDAEAGGAEPAATGEAAETARTEGTDDA